MGSMGFVELGVIVLLALLLFGAGRIAEVGKGLGLGVRHLREGVRDPDETGRDGGAKK